ncbi:MAG: hypothetical protein INQ03_09085 [Candidatus Heimdallarchaeota archaeon]|nr:hypothetical protein [Candidatus Heimdallarchaeota archaeon]
MSTDTAIKQQPIINQFDYLLQELDLARLDPVTEIHLELHGFSDIIRLMQEIRQLTRTRSELNLNFSLVFDHEVPKDVLLRLFGVCAENNRPGNYYQINLYLTYYEGWH